MTFTYDGDLSTDLECVRFYIGDTSASAGVKPDGSNFTDEELLGLISLQGSWQLAVAAAAEVLSALYATEVDIRVGPRSESLSQVAVRFEKLAQTWRRKYAVSARPQVVPTRVDGYSSDVDAEDV